MKPEALVTVECTLLKETEQALRIAQPGLCTWIPRSSCAHISKRKAPNWAAASAGWLSATISMSKSMANIKRLVY